jgi:hypothetical protein
MIEQLICELSTAARELVSGSRRTPSSATDGLRSKNPGAAASRRQKSSVFSTACATASLRLSARRLGGRSWHVVGGLAGRARANSYRRGGRGRRVGAGRRKGANRVRAVLGPKIDDL